MVLAIHKTISFFCFSLYTIKRKINIPDFCCEVLLFIDIQCWQWNDKIKTNEEAITGAKYIIAEWISDNAFYRKWIRNYMYNNGTITSKLKKDKTDENKVYEMYYEYKEAVKTIKPHRILALNRGEKEEILSIKIDFDNDAIINYLNDKIIKNNNSECALIVVDAIKDSLKRLIIPSVEREIRSELTLIASEKSIKVFIDFCFTIFIMYFVSF